MVIFAENLNWRLPGQLVRVCLFGTPKTTMENSQRNTETNIQITSRKADMAKVTNFGEEK